MRTAPRPGKGQRIRSCSASSLSRFLIKHIWIRTPYKCSTTKSDKQETEASLNLWRRAVKLRRPEYDVGP